MTTGVRLQKFLSQAGVASRRSSETLIASGRVRVNGDIVTELGTRVEPGRDRVEVDGEPVHVAATEWLMLHKPRGYMSTREDPEGRRTLYELLPPQMRRLFYVGRLDIDSEGLMLLTNDGDLAHRLLHPSYRIEREYHVELDAAIADESLQQLTQGVTLEDGFARAERIRRLAPARVIVTLREGRKREVRRMMEAVGRRVSRLRRVRYGPIHLGELPEGAWRPLELQEIAALRRLTQSNEESNE